uniref:Calcium channel flower n=1 Tax=Globodera rostochiensis TaxID=31243 RepID=A0A914GST7_GLORO
MQNLLPGKFGQAAQAATTAQTQMKAEHDPDAGFPWWVRFLAKGLGIVGGFVAIFFGVIALITIHPVCIVAALLQITAGFLTIALEAPFCCAFVDFIERIAQFSESRAYWQKAALYGGMGIVPILLCAGTETVLGAGMICASGVAYGFMALGKKADRSTMLGGANVAGQDPAWSPQLNQPFPQPAGFNQP